MMPVFFEISAFRINRTPPYESPYGSDDDKYEYEYQLYFGSSDIMDKDANYSKHDEFMIDIYTKESLNIDKLASGSIPVYYRNSQPKQYYDFEFSFGVICTGYTDGEPDYQNDTWYSNDEDVNYASSNLTISKTSDGVIMKIDKMNCTGEIGEETSIGKASGSFYFEGSLKNVTEYLSERRE